MTQEIKVLFVHRDESFIGLTAELEKVPFEIVDGMRLDGCNYWIRHLCDGIDYRDIKIEPQKYSGPYWAYYLDRRHNVLRWVRNVK